MVYNTPVRADQHQLLMLFVCAGAVHQLHVKICALAASCLSQAWRPARELRIDGVWLAGC